MEIDQTVTMRSSIRGNMILLAIAYVIWLPVFLLFEIVLGIWEANTMSAALLLLLALVGIPAVIIGSMYLYPQKVIVDERGISSIYRFMFRPKTEAWANMQKVVVHRNKVSRFKRFPTYVVQIHKKTLWNRFSAFLMDENAYREVQRRLTEFRIPMTKGKGFSQA